MYVNGRCVCIYRNFIVMHVFIDFTCMPELSPKEIMAGYELVVWILRLLFDPVLRQ